jgi:hypothetical protein
LRWSWCLFTAINTLKQMDKQILCTEGYVISHKWEYFLVINTYYCVVDLYFLFLIRYFLHLHFKCYPKSPLYPPPALLPYPLIPTSWPWRSPVLGNIKFARPKGLSSQWWTTRPSSATYAARDMSSGVTD